MDKGIQAKHIQDEVILNLVGDHSSLFELQELINFPPKVVLAKLRSMVKRGLIEGCTCGCRGDFYIADP